MLIRELLARLEHGQTTKEIAQKLGVGYKSIQRELKSLGYHWDNSKKRWIFKGTLHSVEPLEHEVFTDIEDDFDRSLIPPPAPRRELTDSVFQKIEGFMNAYGTFKGFAQRYWVNEDEVEQRLREAGYYPVNEDDPEGIWKKDETKVKVVPPVSSPVSEEATEDTSTDIHIQFTSEEVADIRTMLEEWKRKEPKQDESQPLHDRIKAIVSQNKIRKTVIINEGISKRLDSFSESERVNKSDVVELALMDFIERYSK